MSSRLAIAFTATAVLWGAAAPDTAAAPIHYTSAWFLGDSLSDPGNLFAATGSPPPPYADGRFSNGPVWAEHIAQDFTGKGLQTGNFAYGGATAVFSNDGIPDLPQQIAMFGAASAGKLGAAPVAHLFFGANDIFGAIAAAATLPPEEAAAAGPMVAGAALAAASAVVNGVVQLKQVYGVEHFVVFNLPALDQTPAFLPPGPGNLLAELGTTVFNDALAAGLAGLGGLANVTTIDTYALFALLIANPELFGLTDVTTPCLISAMLCENPDDLAFFDAVHPNQVVHAALADVVRANVAPVPLPLPGALLAVGLVLMAGLRRRAKD